MSAFYNYSEPFSAECRAFGRLQEAGQEDLAVPCFGYVLLDEEHERVMMEQFKNRYRHLHLCFTGNGDDAGPEDLRSRFPGRDGRSPPIRGIVKAFGQANEPLRAKSARKVLRDVTQLQQLGIIHVDVGHRQLIDGKLADFSTAITSPHYITTPELNPHIPPGWLPAIEFETFQFSINDYWEFDSMVEIWNEEHEDPKDKISVNAFPGGHGCRIHYNLRPRPSLQRVYSLVDPRLYDWRASVTNGAGTGATEAAGGERSRPKAKGSSRGKGKGAISKTNRRLVARPPRWYYNCHPRVAAKLKRTTSYSTVLSWRFKDGLLFPQEKR